MGSRRDRLETLTPPSVSANTSAYALAARRGKKGGRVGSGRGCKPLDQSLQRGRSISRVHGTSRTPVSDKTIFHQPNWKPHSLAGRGASGMNGCHWRKVSPERLPLGGSRKMTLRDELGCFGIGERLKIMLELKSVGRRHLREVDPIA